MRPRQSCYVPDQLADRKRPVLPWKVCSTLNLYGNEDGEFPEGVPVMGASGNLYGTTIFGGAVPCNGAIFRVSSVGKETILHDFKGSPDGANPGPGLILRGGHSLYGVTGGGGNYNAGTVFRMSTKDNEVPIYSFTGGSDGGNPGLGPGPRKRGISLWSDGERGQ